MTIDRIEYLDYLSMTFPSNIAFILRAPPISYVSNIYYLPFTGIVWICSIALVILCTFVIALTLKYHLKYGKEKEDMKTYDFFLFAIASTCQMGTDLITKVYSARISMVSQFEDSIKLKTLIHFINFNYFSVCIFHCVTFHLYFIHCKYCGITSIFNKIDSNHI